MVPGLKLEMLCKESVKESKEKGSAWPSIMDT